jgi:hypothetical protein
MVGSSSFGSDVLLPLISSCGKVTVPLNEQFQPSRVFTEVTFGIPPNTECYMEVISVRGIPCSFLYTELRSLEEKIHRGRGGLHIGEVGERKRQRERDRDKKTDG